MRSKLTIAFLQNLKDGRVSIGSLAEETACTPGQILDFIKYLVSNEIVKIDGNNLEVIANNEKFTNFKRLNLSLTRTFKTQEIKNICEKLTETLFSIVNYLYHNDGSTEESIQLNFSEIKNLNYTLAILIKLKVVAKLGNEYYCAVGANDFKVICEEMNKKGVTLDAPKAQDFISAEIHFGELILTERIDCIKTPTAILCDLYLSTLDEQTKRKLMVKNLNIFAKYPTAINMKESEFSLMYDVGETKMILDFERPLAEQIPAHVSFVKKKNKAAKFGVIIKLNSAR